MINTTNIIGLIYQNLNERVTANSDDLRMDFMSLFADPRRRAMILLVPDGIRARTICLLLPVVDADKARRGGLLHSDIPASQLGVTSRRD
jgi:hypothetical protein